MLDVSNRISVEEPEPPPPSQPDEPEPPTVSDERELQLASQKDSLVDQADKLQVVVRAKRIVHVDCGGGDGSSLNVAERKF